MAETDLRRLERRVGETSGGCAENGTGYALANQCRKKFVDLARIHHDVNKSKC